MVAAICRSASPDRDDRLFPGDVAQFTRGGVGIAYGAAGVLHALHVATGRTYPDWERWLVRAAMRIPNPRVGLYDGLHGAAYVLDRLGWRDSARGVLDRALSVAGEQPRVGLFNGRAGIALSLLHFARAGADRSLWSIVLNMADRLVEEVDGYRPDAAAGPLPAGLMNGMSGPALLFIRLYEETGDQVLLDAATHALRYDLDRCVAGPDGSLQYDDVWRILPYVDLGSAGIGLVLQELARHRVDEEFLAARNRIRLAASPEMVIQSGLFAGRAGLMVYLARERDSLAAAECDEALRTHLRNLSWHGIGYGGGLAFPGNGLVRLSMDYATGTAGVLLATHAAHCGARGVVPFLDPYQEPSIPESPAPARSLASQLD
jgi:hypothetical protein